MTQINSHTIIEALRAAVDQEGDDHTATCVYADGAGPVCIVGMALAPIIGIDKVELLEDGTGYDTKDQYGFGAFYEYERDNGIERFERLTGFTLTPVAYEVLTAAQHEQDNGKTWGVALAKAEEARLNG